MKKRRTKFRSHTAEELKKRNDSMFQKFKKLKATGRYGNMELYQLLADEFDIDERNTVGAIIRKRQKEETLDLTVKHKITKYGTN